MRHLSFILIAAALGGFAFGTMWSPIGIFYFTAALIGSLVGAIELLQRYRSDPFQAMKNRYGIAYLLFHAGVAWMAFYVATLSQLLHVESSKLDLLAWAAMAGLGAVTLLRAKLLDISTETGKPVAIGPEIIVHTFLEVIDRALDREQAEARFRVVRELMSGMDYDKTKLRLTSQVFLAMQGVSEDETEALMERIREIDQMTGVDPQDKSYLLGFYLLDLGGERFLRAIFSRYRDDFMSSTLLQPALRAQTRSRPGSNQNPRRDAAA